MLDPKLNKYFILVLKRMLVSDKKNIIWVFMTLTRHLLRLGLQDGSIEKPSRILQEYLVYIIADAKDIVIAEFCINRMLNILRCQHLYFLTLS